MTVARSVIALVACMIFLGAMSCRAQDAGSAAQPTGAPDTHAPVRFDIDAQPLASALRAFSEATGVAVLFDDDLVAQRATQGLHGLAEPRDALRILLVGTGLDAHFSSMNAFTVTASHDAVPSDATSSVGDAVALDERTAAGVQRAIEQALCTNETTRPGRYRLAMQLWTDDDGVISKVQPLATSGDAARDEKVAERLLGKRLPNVTSRFSPVTVLLRPSARAVSCGGEG